MQCRASTGSNAPELGALLSTEFGLSGESVRTRQILRCDDAERDARVNQEVCREMGIASVVVMPVVHDDEVLGVFELFSGKAKAFGERDLTALQRLGEMVQTAVTLARTAEALPAHIETAKAPEAQGNAEDAEDVLEMQDSVAEVDEFAIASPAVPERPEATEVLEANELPEPLADLEVVAPEAIQTEAEAGVALPSIHQPSTTPQPTNLSPANPVPARKPLLWSAALNVRSDGQRTAEIDQSHIPPAFRNLRKCEACGFPVSAGRALCVECEEKKWRGQLKMSRAVTLAAASGAGVAAAPVPHVPVPEVCQTVPPVSPFTAEAGPAWEQAVSSNTVESKELATAAPALAPLPPVSESEQEGSQQPIPTLLLTAGLEPPQSWLARYKYILGALVVVAGGVAAILLLR